MKNGKVKKIFAVALSASLLASLTVGCSQGGESNDGGNGDEVTIEWWTPNWDEAESREMAEEFEKDNPGIHVEIVITDWDTYKSKITTAISTDNAPELCTVLLTDVAPFAKKGLLEPLDELGAEAGVNFDDILEPALDITTVDDTVYGIPFRYDGSGIYYNVDMLKEAGYDSFPETWDEMVEMAKALSTDGKYAFAWPLGNQANAATRFVQQIYTHGGDVLNEDETECLLDSDEAKAALQNIVDSISQGYASPSSAEYDNTTMREAFGQEQLAFMLTGPFDVETLKTDYPDLNFATTVIPGDGGMGVTTANGWGVILSANSDHKEEAAKFMAYITNPENQARLTDSFPASKTAMEYEQFATEELQPFMDQLDNSRPEPAYERWAEMEPIIYQYMQNAIAGTMTVDEACKAMATDINALLGN
ncbi:MAG TPA: sugar ABC transporter substrate-binding protein [Candidatus Mediterraneibacter stercoripullorum]|nr:sugar ABC transporter substrate-binding protein [Candidatus Mediterraneibacter stercoripullorum]